MRHQVKNKYSEEGAVYSDINKKIREGI